MKKHLRNNRCTYLLVLLLALVSCDRGHEHADGDTYTCPMHPTVISDRPGVCPVCGMDLVRKARPGEEVEITESLAKLITSPNEVVLASVKTVKGEYRALPVSIEAQGVVTYDTRRIYTIPARVGGRLERVYLKHAFQRVAKGQKIAEIYSPELVTAQRELIFLLKNDAGNKFLIDAARRKLELAGMSAAQINAVTKSLVPHNTVVIYSAYSGYVITSREAPSLSGAQPSSGGSATTGSMSGGMGVSGSQGITAMKPDAANTSGALPREGDYVTPGQTLFTIVNSDALRIELSISGNYSSAVKEGTKVQIKWVDGKNESATVDFVQPFFTEGQAFLKVRLYTRHQDQLPVGQLIDAQITLDSTEGLWVPRQSVLDLGLRKVVFVKDDGVLTPREVITGMVSGDLMQISSGLASQDEVAANAQYLVDSESFIKPSN